jgi:hypothetical protein
MFYKVFYTNFFIPKRFAAHTRGPFVFIRPQYQNDLGLLHHELTHVQQWYRNPAFGLCYLFSKKFRLVAEVEAYQEQLKYYQDDQSELFADFIANKYNLDISAEHARQLLLNKHSR